MLKVDSFLTNMYVLKIIRYINFIFDELFVWLSTPLARILMTNLWLVALNILTFSLALYLLININWLRNT